MESPADHAQLTLDEQHAAFKRDRFLAMPVAGAVAWTLISLAGAVLPLFYAVWAVFLGTGVIFYLGLAVGRFTGEDLLGRRRKGNTFDRLFMLTVVMALLVYAIAIPFFRVEPTSLPLSVGILTGLIWVPLYGLIEHWIGLFHGVARTVLVLAAWYLFPQHRFVTIPFVIVAVYLVSIAVLMRRWRRIDRGASQG